MHVVAMDEYHEHFAREYEWLWAEYKRIEELLRNVVWYNFETVVCKWRHPWPESFENSTLQLHAQRYVLVRGRGGRMCEKAQFPLYYDGPVCKAPPLPPEIILHELKLAYEAVKEAEERCCAPYDWAPGGRLYEKMIRTSDGVRAYEQLSSKEGGTENSDDGKRAAFKHGFRLQFGDPMERQAPENAETTAKDILARVCGDRPLVHSRTGC